jgi:pre-rRNA-processing protein TSR3
MRVKVYVLRFGSDDPEKSTALKLVRKGLAIRASISEIPGCSILLTVFSSTVLSPLDRELIGKCGLTVIDSSWKRDIKVIKDISDSWKGPKRILPALMAGNPINYGHVSLLSSAEAVAAALYIAGFIEESFEVLSMFKWGNTFLNLNKDLLESYRKAESPSEVLNVQLEFLKSRKLI